MQNLFLTWWKIYFTIVFFNVFCIGRKLTLKFGWEGPRNYSKRILYPSLITWIWSLIKWILSLIKLYLFFLQCFLCFVLYFLSDHIRNAWRPGGVVVRYTPAATALSGITLPLCQRPGSLPPDHSHLKGLLPAAGNHSPPRGRQTGRLLF